jgi:hypothetical protein
VRGFLSSPRRRRRLGWGGACALLVGGVTFGLIHWSNTATYEETPIRYDEPAMALPVPQRIRFTADRRKTVLQVASQFVATAVKREHVERSYDLVSPTLRTGFTRHAWATQDIPVQPFPLDSARYRFKGSYTDHVWLQVALFPDKAHKVTVPAAVFDIVLIPSVKAGKQRWLVDSWAPAGYQGIPSGPLGGPRDEKGRPIPPGVIEYEGELSQKWLIIPLSAFGLGLIAVGLFALNSWWRGRRALKRYKAKYE